MKKIVNLNIKLIYYIFSILFLIISILVFFVDRNIQYMSSQVKILDNIVWFIPIVIITFIFARFYRNIKLSINLKALIILQIILLIIQIFIAYSIYFYTGWDASTIRNTAFMMVEHPGQIAEAFRLYYSYHVNQTTMAIILGQIMKVFFKMGVINFYFGTVLVSVFIVNLSGLFMTLSIYKITQNKEISFFAWIIFMFLGALSPWVTIPYSDTYSMIFPVFSLFLYLYQPDNNLKYINWFLIAFLSLVGMLVKPQTIIVLIALIIIEVLKLLVNFSMKRCIYFLSILSLTFIASLSSNYIYKSSLNYVNFGLLEGRSFTYSHYLMTGLNPRTYGVFSDEDAALSYSTATIDEREERNWNVIKERLETMGLKGYLEFSAHKILTNFNDGTFAWGGEGGFYVEIFENKLPLSESLRNFYYHNGKYVGVFFQLTQILWLFIIFLLPFNLLKKNKQDFGYLTILITTIGITLFSHLFEARGRYLYSYLPFFIMAASLSFFEISKLISKEYKQLDFKSK